MSLSRPGHETGYWQLTTCLLLYKAANGECSGVLWSQLIQMVHWNGTQLHRQQLSVTLEEATVSVTDEAAGGSPQHSPRGLHPVVLTVPCGYLYQARMYGRTLTKVATMLHLTIAQSRAARCWRQKLRRLWHPWLHSPCWATIPPQWRGCCACWQHPLAV
jgi:hypothetical protein